MFGGAAPNAINSINLTGTGVDLHNGHAFNVSMAYNGTTLQVTITDIKQAGRNVLLTTQTDIRTVDGEHVCTAHSTLVERGSAG